MTTLRAAVVWLLVAVVFVLQNVVASSSRREPFRWLSGVWFELEYWFVFFLATPLFLWAVRRFRFEPQVAFRSLASHSGVAVAFAVTQAAMAEGLNYLTLRASAPPNDPRIQRFISTMWHAYPLLVVTALWKYAVIIGIGYAFYYYRSSRDHQVRAATLEAQLTAAQLQTLRMQLHPHFLFNTLNSAAMLTVTAPRQAHTLLVQLADLLRATLHVGAPAEVPLERELEFLDRYLAIERTRFEGRLTTRFDVPDDTERLLVPTMILQPLVENAMRHGLNQDTDTHIVIIRATRAGNMLVLEVADDGAGVPHDWEFASHAGFGLTNVQDRVNAAHGTPHALEFTRPEGGGFAVRMRLPARTADAGA